MGRVPILTALLGIVLAGCSRIPVDERLNSAIIETAQKAPIGLRFATIRGEYRMRLRHVLRTTPFYLVVSTVSRFLNDSDPKKRAVACNILYTYVKNERENLRGSISRIPSAAVDNLIEGTGRIEGRLAFYAVRATVYAATLKKRYGKLCRMLERHPQRAVRAEGYARLMTYGRLDVLPRLQRYARSGEEYPSLSALMAPMWMYDYSAGEKKAVVSWLLPYLRGTDPVRARIAARVLFNKIGGRYMVMVLVYLEKQAGMLERAGKAPSRDLMAFFRGLRIHGRTEAVRKRYVLLRDRLERMRKK